MASAVGNRKLSVFARMGGALYRFRRADGGIAALEFAIIAPIMLLLSVAAVEIGRAVEINRRFGTVTSMTAHLVAREKTLSDADLQAISEIAAHIMRPYDASSLRVTIISVKAASSDRNDTRVEWAYSSGTGATKPEQCESYPLPENLLDPGASTIVVRTGFDFTPALATDFVGPMTWSNEAMHSPRNSCVNYNGQQCLLSCPGFN
jgi:Flp pilus assembly protein TadG